MLKKMQFVGGCFLFSLFSLLSLNAGAQSTLLGPVKIHANQIDNGTDVLEGPAYQEGGDFLGRCKNGGK